MWNTDIEKNIDFIVNYYSKDVQIDICAEELSEFIVELFHAKRGKNNYHKILTELADSYIMLRQMEKYFEIISDDLIKEINFKLNRQIERINQISKGV